MRQRMEGGPTIARSPMLVVKEAKSMPTMFEWIFDSSPENRPPLGHHLCRLIAAQMPTEMLD